MIKKRHPLFNLKPGERIRDAGGRVYFRPLPEQEITEAERHALCAACNGSADGDTTPGTSVLHEPALERLEVALSSATVDRLTYVAQAQGRSIDDLLERLTSQALEDLSNNDTAFKAAQATLREQRSKRAA